VIHIYIGNVLLTLSIIFVFVGLIGVFRFENFYAKVLTSSKIDTAATITLIAGVAVRSGFSWFTLKALLILVFVLFINPVNTSKIVMSARRDKSMEGEEQNGN